MDDNARSIAEAFVAARTSRTTLATYPGRAPADLAEAYAAQDAALELWERKVGGWKVGRIGAPDVGRLGADRLVGPVFSDSIVFDDSASISMPIFDGGFAAAEAEFMLRLGPQVGTSPPLTNEQAMQCVDAVRIGIEIASSPYPAINREGPCVTISDHGNNAGLLFGAEIPIDRWDNLDAVAVSLAIDGKMVGEATTATMLDGPFGAVRFLLGNLADRGIVAKPGWWISSGAITGVHEVASGDFVTASFSDLGEISCRIG